MGVDTTNGLQTEGNKINTPSVLNVGENTNETNKKLNENKGNSTQAIQGDVKEKAQDLKANVKISQIIEEKGVSLEATFLDVKNVALKNTLQDSLSRVIDQTLSAKGLTLSPLQKNAVSVGLLGKITHGEIFSKMATLNEKAIIPVFQALEAGDIKTALTLLGTNNAAVAKSMDTFNFDKIAQTLLQKDLEQIQTIMISENNSDKLLRFLQNPKAIEQYTGGPLPENTADMTKQELTNYCQNLNNELLVVDKSLSAVETTGQKAIKTLATKVNNSGAAFDLDTMPKEIKDIIKGFMDSLMQIPILGDLIAKMLGLKKDGAKDSQENASKEEERAKKSLSVLQQYGQNTVDGKAVASPKNGTIDFCKDQNTSLLQYADTKAFFSFCDGIKCDTQAPDFWEKVFNKKEPLMGKNAAGEDVVVVLPEWESSDWEDSAKGLKEKLNSLGQLNKEIAPVVKVEPQQTNTAPMGDVAVVPQQAPEITKESATKEVEKAIANAVSSAQSVPFSFSLDPVLSKKASELGVNVPTKFEYDKGSKTISLGDSLKYKVQILPFQKSGMTIDNAYLSAISADESGFKLTGTVDGLFGKSETFAMSRDDAKNLITSLYSSGSFTYSGGGVVTQINKA